MFPTRTLALTATAAGILLLSLPLAPSPTAAAGLRPATPPALSAQARRGLAFAQARCAACHGVTPGAASPNPESPSFEAVVNTPGLTGTTLRQFLRDSHNYPQAMNFTVPPARLDELTAYMLTLRSPRYRPAI